MDVKNLKEWNAYWDELIQSKKLDVKIAYETFF